MVTLESVHTKKKGIMMNQEETLVTNAIKLRCTFNKIKKRLRESVD